MDKNTQIKRIETSKLIAIIRSQSCQELMEVVSAILAGGIDVIEVTMTTPNALDVIRNVSGRFGDKILMGAGSVLDAQTARAAMLAGAEFIVSPVTRPDVIQICSRYGKVSIPGALTPTEILDAWDAGADFVKVFPCTRMGPGYIKDVLAPMPQLKLVPTGGVSAETAGEFLSAGAVALGVGGSLVSKKLIDAGRFDQITEAARQLVEAVKKNRS
jgi:2-dehydro-3-deoxyphosphogluconate aldolase/(4S)-4-hydroxy-2-oxoglutarate aldolase